MYKRGLNSKVQIATDACVITKGTKADCKLGEKLIDGLDTGMAVYIHPKKNRKVQRKYNKDLYKWRHIIENIFLMLKGRRGIATRYTKNTDSLPVAIQIRAMFD